MRDVVLRDLTDKDLSCDALLSSATDGALRPNRALADRLALVHRVSYELLVSADAPEPDMSPEAKLLRAIFGENADAQVDVPEIGATVWRGDRVIAHPHGKAFFAEAASAEVEEVVTEKDDLPAGMSERIRVVVRWPGPITVGDILLADGEALGVVDGIVLDDLAEPRLYVAGASLRSARITRRMPTAKQRVAMRGIGAYDPITERPVDGRELRLDQLEWLAEAGGRAIVSEMATYTTGDPRMRTLLFERLVKMEPIEEGGS